MPNLYQNNDYLKSILDYESSTGILYWKVDTRKTKPGDPAGCLNQQGYVQIYHKGKNYLAHRLAWVYSYGSLPEDKIDHIDGVRTNNRISNLRACNNSENMQNIKSAYSNNKLGVLGVTKNGIGYAASINYNHTKLHLGTFKTLEEASEVYLTVKRNLHTYNKL